MKFNKLLKDSVLATLFVFSVMWLIFNVSQFKIFNAFDPIGDALDDMEITDIAFSQLRKDPLPDTNIVIVNIGYLDRAGIAQEINVINKYNPAVMGFDCFFDHLKSDSLTDLVLADAISRVTSPVFASQLMSPSKGENRFDSLRCTHPLFRGEAVQGFVNLESDAQRQEDFKTCRAFPTIREVGEQVHRAFAIELAALYASEKADKVVERGNSIEIINYRGNVFDYFGRTEYPNMFYVLDVDDVLNENFVPQMIEGKIVVFGFLGRDLKDTSWDDKFFTPLNKNYAGKTNPDMFGAVVHANILSMILNDDYIDELNDKEGWGILVAVVLCFVNVLFFSYIYYRLPAWYDGITKTVQLLEILLIIYIMVVVLSEFNFKLNLVISIAAIALAGDALEVFYGMLKNLFRKIRRN